MYKITILPGDGIGPEVAGAAKKVIEFAAETFNIDIKTEEKPIGGAAYDQTGDPFPDDTLKSCYDSDAVFLGAVGGPKYDDLPRDKKPETALLALRKSLGLFANYRPAKVYDALLGSSTIKEEVLKGTDIMILRELTGGIYFGEPRGREETAAWNTMIYTKDEIERIADKAFEAAAKRNGKVTSVDKANVLEVSRLWRETLNEKAKNYPNVKLDHMYVDNAAMQIIRDPKQFDVIVTSNMFGDILSDIAAMITGSLGMLPSASIGEKYALYEPVHGSAPEIAGKNQANPIAAITSVAMMFKYTFEMDKIAEVIERAVAGVLAQGYRTNDIYTPGSRSVGTGEMTAQIIKEAETICADEALNVFTL